jgi:conjugal transfer/entry exclusion protein
MNNNTSIRPKASGPKQGQVLSVLVAILLATTNLAQAQVAAVAASPSQGTATREQVKMERDEFLKTHRYDSQIDNWVLKPEFEAPAGVKSRDQVKAERSEFLRNNHYDDNTSTWVPISGSAMAASAMTRQQMRDETRQFMRTHQFDEVNQVWKEVKPPAKKG